MNILVVFGHPLQDSYNAALRDRAIAALEAGGHAVDLCDLYAEGFEPRLSADERRHYHDLSRNQAPMAAEVARLQWAEGLVLIFPIWSYGMPAIVKGWFDRVILPGFAFEVAQGRIVPGLRHIRLLAVVTTYGQPWWTAKALGDPVRKTIMRGYARLMDRQVRRLWLAKYDMNRAKPPDLKRFLDNVGKRFTAV